MEKKLTDLEFRLMDNIAHCEMGPLNTGTPTCADEANTFLWLDDRAVALGISAQSAGGVLTSLKKKGFIGVLSPNVKMSNNPQAQRNNGRDPDGGVWFTDAGFEVWKSHREEVA